MTMTVNIIFHVKDLYSLADNDRMIDEMNSDTMIRGFYGMIQITRHTNMSNYVQQG